MSDSKQHAPMPRIIREMKRFGFTAAAAVLLLAAMPALGALPTATFNDITVMEGTGGTTNAQFTVVSSAPLGYDVFYDVTVTPDSAHAGDDYTLPASTTFMLAAGTTTATYTVPIVADAVREDDELFSVTITDHYGNGPQLARTTAVCTIVNDDAGFDPDHALMPVNGSTKVRFDFGTTLSGTTFLAFSSTDPDVVPPPAALNIPPGSRSADVFIVPVADGTALVTGILSNGGTGAIAITAYTDHAILTRPTSLSIRTGATVQLAIALDPPAGSPVTVTLAPKDPGYIEVPDTVTVPAGGSVLIPVHGINTGLTSLGLIIVGRSISVPVLVSPFELEVDTITPPTASSDGGAQVVLGGAGFSSFCHVTFGGLAAPIRSSSSTELVVVTPPHAPGNVDVHIVCNTSETTLPDAFGYVRAKRRIAGH
jgi:hypothetical protein